MKTNHNRGFVDEGSFRDPSMMQAVGKGQEATFCSKGIGNDFTNGHRGAARAKHGAKSYVRSQIRKEGKRICKREQETTDEQD